jgi:hypothetical protein
MGEGGVLLFFVLGIVDGRNGDQKLDGEGELVVVDVNVEVGVDFWDDSSRPHNIDMGKESH